jgi:hypothetical protein
LHLQEDISLLKIVRRKATKLIYYLRYKSYDEKFKGLKLTFEMQQTSGDLTEVFKILKSFCQIDSGSVFGGSEELN